MFNGARSLGRIFRNKKREKRSPSRSRVVNNSLDQIPAEWMNLKSQWPVTLMRISSSTDPLRRSLKIGYNVGAPPEKHQFLFDSLNLIETKTDVILQYLFANPFHTNGAAVIRPTGYNRVIDKEVDDICNWNNRRPSLGALILAYQLHGGRHSNNCLRYQSVRLMGVWLEDAWIIPTVI